MATEYIIADSEVREQHRKYTKRKVFFVIALVPALFLIVGIALSLGSADITIWDAYAAVLHKFFPSLVGVKELADICVWELRLPRILMGIIAGVGLAVTGCIMQSVLRNPLASPYTLGIASAAGFGASLAILAGVGFAGGQYIIIGNAFIFSMIGSAIILGLAGRKGATPESMILAGVAMLYLFNAMTTFLQYMGEADAVKEAIFWMVGDLSRAASWENIYIVSAVSIVCIPLLLLKSWDLNVMSAGEEAAESLGINVKRTRIFIMTVSTLLVSSIICFTGTIGFIGLVAPHIVRMFIGGDNRYLLPASALFGALMLLIADTAARRILAPEIIPVGVLTAFLGVPLFLYLIMRRRRDYF